MDRIPQSFRSEDGAVLPWFAIWLPVLIVFVVLVVDVANWFEHKRHLQLQADAAALAGAGKFKLPLSLCDDAAVKNEARNYAGQHLDGAENLWASLYNHQIGGTPASRVHALINFDMKALDAVDYPGRFWRSATDDDGGSPCAAMALEVKLTETNLPWFFGLPPSVVPWIDAHARVSLMQLGTATGLLPIGVPETDPDMLTVTFVNECDGSTIATTQLKKQATLDTDPAGEPLVVWMNNGTGLPDDPGPLGVAMPSTCTKVGVRVAIASRGTSADCTNQFVDCYEAASGSGAGFVRSFPASGGTASAPRLASVELIPAATGCSDPYFYSDERPCGAVGVRATLDFGGPPPPNAQLEARFNSANPWRNLTDPDNDGVWETTGTPFDTNDNQGNPLEDERGIELRWKSDAACSTGQGCPVEAGNVQWTYGAADHLTGPIKMLQVFESGVRIGAEPGGTTPQLVVRVALTSSLKVAADVTDPPVALKLVGNQTQALNCDVDFTTLTDELAYGCGQRVPPATPTSPFSEGYTENTGQLNCRDTTRTELWAMAVGGSSDPPWPCVALKTGHTTNQVPQGLNTRILGTDKPVACTSPNDWASYPDLDPEDPRIVHVFITPFGAFAGTGNDETVPVVGFATFYVTGWTGQGSGFDNPCQGFVPSDDPVPNGDPGTIVGHFIRYIANVNTGSNGQVCVEDSLTPCVAVLTG